MIKQVVCTDFQKVNNRQMAIVETHTPNGTFQSHIQKNIYAYIA